MLRPGQLGKFSHQHNLIDNVDNLLRENFQISTREITETFFLFTTIILHQSMGKSRVCSQWFTSSTMKNKILEQVLALSICFVTTQKGNGFFPRLWLHIKFDVTISNRPKKKKSMSKEQRHSTFHSPKKLIPPLIVGKMMLRCFLNENGSLFFEFMQLMQRHTALR